MKHKINYDGYLTEDKLVNLFSKLQKINKNKFSIETEFRIQNTRLRGDLVITIEKTKNKYLIEFDGFRHFNNSKVILNDCIKDKIWEKTYKTKVIRIPYFLQLNSLNFKYYFHNLLKEFNCKNNFEIINNYKHGFIDKQALLPSDFNSLGIKKFEKFLDFDKKLKNKISSFEDIIDSLIKLIIKKQNKEEIIYEEFIKKYGKFIRKKYKKDLNVLKILNLI